ncbi:regulatory protein GemA [Acidovorax sp. SUPP2522]|uniref:regulatory protein GemA n=1 Tax=unclassified Acidovorax TaxID=2684926 RepID=UPI002349CA49|nr:MULTISPECIES: regulatory protein GemA [unclassified Acidovorax]WCM99937.1 regulatory protein GemA [Acidovorax sp. GBBC 1281]GKT19764.1 regulatory protein GemA [Acidovorax sp. SUPP2522]
MTTKQKPSADAGRVRLIKLVHVARRDLERAGTLDEPGYRDILRAASGGRHDSAAAMSYADLKAALERLKRAGFKVRKPAGSRPMVVNPDASKVRALWLFLHALGAVSDPSEQALAAYVRRTVKVDDLRWARGDRVEKLIETLKKWAMRCLPAAVAALRDEVIAAHRASPLSPARADLALQAQRYLNRGEGFDMHWWAWECLMAALERPVAADLAALPRQEVVQ